MAVSMSMMFGRLGSAIGANFVAVLLDNYCEVAFYMSGISLIGNCIYVYRYVNSVLILTLTSL